MNVPKLRFKEFTDDYKKYKYKDVLKIKSGRDQKQIMCSDGKYPILGTGGVIGKTNNFLYNKPSVLIGRKGTIDKPQYMETPFWTVDTLFYSEISSNNFPKYIYYSFQNVNWKKYDESTGVPSLSCSTIENIACLIPSPEEQTKIASFLSLLDKKIELQTKKIEDLKLYKSSQINNKLSSINCEEIELKKIGNFISGNSIGKDKVGDSGIPLVLYGDLYTKYNEEIYEVNLYTKDNSKYIKSEIGDILFPTSTTVDALSLISPSRINIKGVVYGGDLIIFRVNNKEVDSTFLSYQINNYKRKEFSKKAQGTTIIHIHSDDLLNSKIKLPSLETQKLIANFGNRINKKIDLEINKLLKLIELKKGLMQNMFV